MPPASSIAAIIEVVVDADRNSRLAQPFDDIAVCDIAALNLVAELVHHLRDSGHADPADADEMDRSNVRTQCLHAGTPWA